jgi:hypothetical protein
MTDIREGLAVYRKLHRLEGIVAVLTAWAATITVLFFLR